MSRRRRLALTLYATLALTTTALVLGLWAFDVFRGADLETVDVRFEIRGEHAASDVVVVAIDTKTLTRFGRFPFRRTRHANVIRRLARARARVIAYDVQFTEQSGDREADNALVLAADRAPRIVLGTSEVGRNGESNVFGGDDLLAELGVRAASVNLPNDPGGVLRRLAYDESGLLSFPVVAAELARGRPVVSRTDFDSAAGAWTDYPGPPGTVRTVSFSDVARTDPRVFRDKVVVVGATAQSLKDVFPTATSSAQLMSGPEIQAAAIQTVLDGLPLRSVPGWVDGALMAVLARAEDGLRLGGERKVVTVMFSDVRGFTAYSEKHAPEEVIEVLNEYLSVMSDVILAHGGTLVAYMGDGIMAVFGAPADQVDHADRALGAAEEMAGPALVRVNDLLRARGDEPFQIGIGLNAGPVMAGNVGSQRRMEYTTIGDTTNTASRLETMTKGTGHTIFLSESVRGMLTRTRDDLVLVDRLQVRGKVEPVTVWSVT